MEQSTTIFNSNSKTKINNDTIDVLDLIMPEQHEHYTITALERDQ
jgi:hypothetical protein